MLHARSSGSPNGIDLPNVPLTDLEEAAHEAEATNGIDNNSKRLVRTPTLRAEIPTESNSHKYAVCDEVNSNVTDQGLFISNASLPPPTAMSQAAVAESSDAVLNDGSSQCTTYDPQQGAEGKRRSVTLVQPSTGRKNSKVESTKLTSSTRKKSLPSIINTLNRTALHAISAGNVNIDADAYTHITYDTANNLSPRRSYVQELNAATTKSSLRKFSISQSRGPFMVSGGQKRPSTINADVTGKTLAEASNANTVPTTKTKFAAYGSAVKFANERFKRGMSKRSLFSAPSVVNIAPNLLGDGDGGATVQAGGEQSGSGDGVFGPFTWWLLYWQWFINGAIIYQILVLPFELSFWNFQNDITNRSVATLFSLDLCTDLLLIIDIYIKMHTAYTDNSVLVTDKRSVRSHYLRTWCAIDVCAALPFDFLQLIDMSVIPLTRINKILRIGRCVTFFSGLDASSNTSSNSAAFANRLIKLIFFTFLLGHIVACIKYQIMLADETSAAELTASSDAPEDDIAIQTLPSRGSFGRYLQALYWSIGAVTGRDDTTPPATFDDTLFTVIMMVVGMLWFAYIVASLESFAESSTNVSSSYQARLKQVNTFMATYRIPLDMQMKVRAYYSYWWSSDQRFDRTPLIDSLPAGLKSDVFYHLYGDVLQNAELFANTGCNQNGFLALIAAKVQPMTCIPNEVICHHSTAGDCMWFILEGEVEILVGKNAFTATANIATLRKGDYFGEYSIFVTKYRTSTAKAVTYCTLLKLTRDEMRQALNCFPGYDDMIKTYVLDHRGRTKQQESNLLGLDEPKNGRAGTLNGAKAVSVKSKGYSSGAADDKQGSASSAVAMKNAKLKRLIMVQETNTSGLHSKQAMHDARWTFRGDAWWYQCFVLVYILFVLYNAILLPVRFGWFTNPHRIYVTFFVLDYTGDTVFLLDMWLQTRLRFIDRGEEVKDASRIRQSYVFSTLFLIHIAGTIPFDLLTLVPAIGLTAFTRLNRCLRLYHMNQIVLRHIKHIGNHEAVSLVYFIFAVLLLSHWTASIYFTFTQFEGFTASNDDWGVPAYLENESAFSQYLRAQYYSLTYLAGIGRHNFPPTDVDVILTVILMLMGVFVVSYVIGKVGYLVLNLNAAAIAHKKQISYYHHCMKYNNFESDLTERINLYFAHKWNIQRGIDPNKALEGLPYSLRADIMYHLCGDLIRSVPKFKTLETHFIRALSAELSFVELPANEYVFRQGFTGNCIYFVGNGLIELVIERSINTNKTSDSSDTSNLTESTLKVLGAGSFFGEGSLFTGRRSVSARTKCSAQLLMLTNDSFAKIAQLNLSFATVIKKLNDERQARIQDLTGGQAQSSTGGAQPPDSDNTSGQNGSDKMLYKLTFKNSHASPRAGNLQTMPSIAQAHDQVSKQTTAFPIAADATSPTNYLRSSVDDRRVSVSDGTSKLPQELILTPNPRTAFIRSPTAQRLGEIVSPSALAATDVEATEVAEIVRHAADQNFRAQRTNTAQNLFGLR